MAPHIETETTPDEPQYDRLKPFSADNYRFKINTFEAPWLIIYSIGSFYGGYLLFTQGKLVTIIFSFFMVNPSMLGITAGIHRLWSHRSFKAKPPLELFLLFLYILTHQRSPITWVRRHRLHHSHSDTDADPHNASRGFFFSHFGFLLVLPHPECEKRLKMIDVSDMWNNPYTKFTHDHYPILCAIIAYAIPTYIPTLWGETLHMAFWANIFRIYMVLNLSCSINSISHLVGYKPIDVTAAGTQCHLIGIANLGEGYHNYHHSFPLDYRTSELGDTKYNQTTLFIDFMAKLGLAYDMKTTSEDVVRARVLKKGDGTDQYYIPNNEKKQKIFCTTIFKNAVNSHKSC